MKGDECWTETPLGDVPCSPVTKRLFSTAISAHSGTSFALGVLDLPESLLASDEPAIRRRLKIFRIGTFKDSKGRERTWTGEDLDLMAYNFTALRDAGIVPNVPIRIDHTDLMRDVVGWFVNIYRDPTEPMFLFADIEFTEPEALEKFNRKTLRNRSIEIGRYESNGGQVYEPAVLGLAWVDLPAVEGLFGINRDPGEGASGAGAPAPLDPANPKGATMAMFKIKGVETADAAAVQAHIEALEARPAPVEPYTFKLNGVESTDPAAVQAHVSALESFRIETIESGRTGFVEGLAKDNKIGNPQKEAFSALVKTMTDEQFDTFKRGWDGAAALNLLSKHDLGDGGEKDPTGTDTKAQAISDLEEIIANHKRAGKTDEQIKELGSFKQLQALRATKEN